MKAIKFNTANGTAVLTYSEVAQKWDGFSGALNTLESMCSDMGWNWNSNLQNYYTNFAAENVELFAGEVIENFKPKGTVLDRRNLYKSIMKNNKKEAKHLGGEVNKPTSLFCENCGAYNVSLILLNNGGDKYLLCPRCLKILEQLEDEYRKICEIGE